MQTDATDLIDRARAGDHDAFRDLVAGHSHELQVHCYRILGSLQDAEDALQETLVSVEARPMRLTGLRQVGGGIMFYTHEFQKDR